MDADWPLPDELVASLGIAPGIPARAARWILRQATGYYAQDAADLRAAPVWRKALHVWACKVWSDPKKRAEAMAASAPSQQVGGHHEGPVERIDPPKEWTEAVRRPVEPAPKEAFELLARLDAARVRDGLPPIASADRPAPGSVARPRGQNGGGGGHG